MSGPPAFGELGMGSFESAFGCGQKLPSDGVMIGMEWDTSGWVADTGGHLGDRSGRAKDMIGRGAYMSGCI